MRRGGSSDLVSDEFRRSQRARRKPIDAGLPRWRQGATAHLLPPSAPSSAIARRAKLALRSSEWGIREGASQNCLDAQRTVRICRGGEMRRRMMGSILRRVQRRQSMGPSPCLCAHFGVKMPAEPTRALSLSS